jgi:PAS domain S-box-containing protein
MIDKGDILIVDDTHASLKLLTDILTKEGYQVRPADSGELALSSIAAKLPELILLDIRMPGMDGFEVLRRVKTREESRNIPIIFLSASVGMDERIEGLKLGAVDFVSKPFHPEELLARVQTQVELSRLRIRLEQQAIELQQSEEKFRTIFENSSSALAIIEKDTTISMVNKEYCKIGMYEEKDVLGTSWTKQIPPEDLERLKEYNRRRLIDPKSAPDHYEFSFYRKDGTIRNSLMSVATIPTNQKIICSFIDISERKQAEQALREAVVEREKLIQELQFAMDNVKTLQGLIPICASCKKIRDDQGFWNQVEGYISKHTDAKFSHGICPDCAKKLYGDLYEKVIEEQKKKNL